MVKYFLLASTIISGAMALALPASAAMPGLEVTRSNPAVVGTTSTYSTPNSTLLVQVADDDDQGEDNDDQGEDGE
jgi:hypothetical protein